LTAIPFIIILVVKRLTIIDCINHSGFLVATLQDVAKRAGVSTATVSKVLSNTPYFTEATRQKVMKAVEELGYVRNIAAVALSSGKTQIIAVVFPYIYEAFFTDPLTLRILEGIEGECTQRGYNMLLSTPRLTQDGPDNHYLALIRSGYIDGIIAIDNVPNISVLKPVDKSRTACITIGYQETDLYIRSDDFSGGQQIMQHILEQGHKHIGIISIPEDMNVALNYRMDGMRSVAEDNGINFAELPTVYGDFSTANGISCTKELLEQHPQLTAIICLNDRMAIGAIQQAQAMGRKVPDDLAVAGYDDIPAAEIYTPRLTTINQQAPVLGHKAAQMLFDVLDGKAPSSINLATHLVVRESTIANSQLH
jgi:DNA-binding LacI/PurR family transcriptional regulator